MHRSKKVIQCYYFYMLNKVDYLNKLAYIYSISLNNKNMLNMQVTIFIYSLHVIRKQHCAR